MKERPKDIGYDEWVWVDNCEWDFLTMDADTWTGRIRFRTKDRDEFIRVITREKDTCVSPTVYVFSRKASPSDIECVTQSLELDRSQPSDKRALLH